MGRKLTPAQRERLMSPITTALIAMRLGRCNYDHAHDVLAQLLIAYRVCQLVPRHRHLRDDIRAAESAVHNMIERHNQRTVKDAYVNGTDDEIDALELAAQIYEALLKTTPLRTFRRAVINVKDVI